MVFLKVQFQATHNLDISDIAAIWLFKYKLKIQGKTKYFHSRTFLDLTDTVKSKLNI